MMRRVVVTGLGLVTPIGIGKDAFWKNLSGGVSGVDKLKNYDYSEIPVQIGAEVKDFKPEEWIDPKELPRTDQFVQFAIAAAQLATQDAGLDWSKVDTDRVGTLISTGIGGLQTLDKNIKMTVEKGYKRVSPLFIPMMIGNMASAMVSMKYKLRGPSSNIVTACATSNYALGEAAELIKREDADMMLAGGVEASLIPLGIAGFANMKALSTRNDDPQKASRPFDKDRDGFVMGEGGIVLVLEELEHAIRRGANIYCELLSIGYSSDAYHITAPDPEGWGGRKCMENAIKKAGIKPEQIDYINAHGTSTPMNDRIESKAIGDLFGSHTGDILVNSTKSLVGHLLGAAGAIEAAAISLQIANSLVHPSLNFEQGDEGFNLNVARTATKREINYVLSNSFGFGGHNSSLCFGRYR
jgi:3-oxoacyl-[acyl-carrier-protein] synthase II